MSTQTQDKVRFQYYRDKILRTLAENPDGLYKSQLRAVAFNRINKAVSDKWLDTLEASGLIQSKPVFTGQQGRPGVVYSKTKNGTAL